MRTIPREKFAASTVRAQHEVEKRSVRFAEMYEEIPSIDTSKSEEESSSE